MIINEKRNLNYLITSYKALQHNTMLIIHLQKLKKKNKMVVTKKLF